jgi:aspartyl-tRNA(Asn)/glutamyl-tRNA(Gln) amidotransferase subunit A
MQTEPHTVAELARAIRTRTRTAELATRRCLEAIADRNPSLNAFITVCADDALARARQADADIAAGRDRGPLHGVPISLKDLFDVAGVRTTAASRVRARHIAHTDATIVQRLRTAGAVVVGKNNLHEFALGTTNEDSAFGPARHPLDMNRSPGGSSGGSAAAVLAGMAARCEYRPPPAASSA